MIEKEIWKRKHVDWEISSRIRSTRYNPRCALLGIFLRFYQFNNDKSDHSTIPARLYENWNKSNFYNKERYAALYKWNTDANTLSQWTRKAFQS